jgi:hypothetical protein
MRVLTNRPHGLSCALWLLTAPHERTILRVLEASPLSSYQGHGREADGSLYVFRGPKGNAFMARSRGLRSNTSE